LNGKLVKSPALTMHSHFNSVGLTCVSVGVRRKLANRVIFYKTFGTVIHFDSNYVKFVGQGHRSKFLTGGKMFPFPVKIKLGTAIPFFGS